ncbi:MAG: PIN domain-containing protein, partial [Nakamurella sp.]
MIVLDASVLIAALTPADGHHRAAHELLSPAIIDNEGLMINPVTLAEVLVLPTREGRAAEVRDLVLIELGVIEVPFPQQAAWLLARLRATGVKMPDCCVLMTAMETGATLASFDDRLRRAA